MVSLPNQQPGAHKQETENDPFIHIKIPFAGDQFTRVRFVGANTHLQIRTFEHCYPFKPVMWHCKASVLQYCYCILYIAESLYQIGTIKF